VELLNVKLRAFPHPAPEDRPALLMNLEHVLFRLLSRESKNFLEDHRDVTHQVDRVIVHDDLPGKIELLGCASLLLDRRIFH